MILSNYDEFMKFIPTTFDACQDFNLYAEWVEIAEQTAMLELFGEDLYNHISSLPDDNNFRTLCKRYVCHLGLFEAIPNLDLVLTNNGFGVVGGNNSKFLPASKDRVAALRFQEDVWKEKFRESIIRRLSVVPEYQVLWKKNPTLCRITDNLFVGYTDFCTYVAADDMRNPEVYRQARARIPGLLAEYIHPYISSDYYLELLDKQYTSIVTTPDYIALQAVKTVIGVLIRNNVPTGNDWNAAHRTMEATVNTMCLQPDCYPTYMASSEYALKMAVQYENKPEHATYFGGI